MLWAIYIALGGFGGAVIADMSLPGTTQTQPGAGGDLLGDPDVAAALAAIARAGESGVDVLAPPAPTTPDWNKLAAADDNVPGGTRSYQTPGSGQATLVSWNFATGDRSGHLAVTGANMLASASLGVNAGATLTPTGPVQLNVGLNGSENGAWNSLLSSQVALGKMKLTASGTYADKIGTQTDAGQLGYSVTAGSDLTDQLSVNGALNWSRADTSATDSRGYHGAVHLNRDLGSDLKLTGELGVSASGPQSWVLAPQGYATTGLQWAPGGSSVVSATLTDQSGTYRLAAAAGHTFE